MSENSAENMTEKDALNKALPNTVSKIRDAFIKHTAPKYDRYGEGLVAQAYFAARNSATGSYTSIAKEMHLDTLTFQYYMEKYPDFVLAVNMGRNDGMKDRVDNIENALLARALGVEIEEQIEEQSGVLDEDGNLTKSFKKVKTVKKQIPPDTQAALAILQKIDPNWNPKATIDVNVNQLNNVTEDVSINVDLRNLSPKMLKELLNGTRIDKNNDINNTPEDKSVRFLGESGDEDRARRDNNKKKSLEKKKAEKELEKGRNTKKRVMSQETRDKISRAAKERYSNKLKSDENQADSQNSEVE